MNAKNRFDATIERCYDLVDDFEAGSGAKKNADLLRAAVVLAVAALDKYCKDRFMESFGAYYDRTFRNRGLDGKHMAYLKKVGITTEDMLKIYMENADRSAMHPARWIGEKLQAHLYKETFQSGKAISELFQFYGLEDIITHAVEKGGNKRDIWKKVEMLVARRHQITHAADYESDTLAKLDKKTVEEWLGALVEFVGCVHAIVGNRFKESTPANVKPNNVKVSLNSRKKKEFSAAFNRNKGYLDADELSCLRRIADIEELFGVKARRMGFLVFGSVDCPATYGHAELWWPRVMTSEPNYAGWINTFENADGVFTIVERNVTNTTANREAVKKNCADDKVRIVLGVVEGDESPVGYCYRFLGVFRLDIAESKRRNACIWRRTASRLELK